MICVPTLEHWNEERMEARGAYMVYVPTLEHWNEVILYGQPLTFRTLVLYWYYQMTCSAEVSLKRAQGSISDLPKKVSLWRKVTA